MCYDPSESLCDKEEDALRYCFALMSCFEDAKIVYDGKRPRKQRVEANKSLQRCLETNHTAELQCKPRE